MTLESYGESKCDKFIQALFMNWVLPFNPPLMPMDKGDYYSANNRFT